MTKTITTEELSKKIENHEDFLIVDVLSSNSFEMRHIPGAKNVPYDGNFAKNFEEETGASKDKEIILYCASSGCQLSVLASEILEKAGHTNVLHYKDGLAGWRDEGHSFEGQAA